jgi:hypothetical protein
MKSGYSRIKNLPKYVMMMQDGRKGCAMKLQKTNDKRDWEYWRHAGLWGIAFRMENGKLVSDAKHYGPELQYLDGQELVPITEEEWRKDNEEYV